MITNYSAGSAMLKRYIEINNFKQVATFKEGRGWQVYLGVFDGITMQGFKEGPLFDRQWKALDYANKCANQILSVYPEKEGLIEE